MRLNFIISLLTAALFLIRCSSDNPVEPEKKSKIEGTITFSGQWSETPEDIRVVAAVDFPIKSFNDLIQSGSLEDNGSVSYSIELENGFYKFVGVIWKAQDGNWGLASICGVYSDDQDFNTPKGISLSSDNSTVSGIDISVNRSRGKVLNGSQITGTVNLQGAWPDEYSSAMVFSTKRDMISEQFDLLDLNMGTALERGQASANYTIETPADTNRSIGLAFLDINGTLTEEAVYFSQNNGGMEINEQLIAANETIDGPDFDMQLGSVTSAVKGTISFIGDWPATAEEVRLITATTYPPSIDELIIGEEISPDVSTHKYTFYLEPNTYRMMGVAWRAEGTEWDIMSICGAYFAGEDSLAPSDVIIPNEDSIVEDINIVVNRSKARKVSETYIQGNVVFNGEWPSVFTEARVVATTKFQIFPPILPTMLDLAFSAPIEVGLTSVDYNIKAFPGTFAAIGVIFLKEDQTLTIEDIIYSLDVDGLNLVPFEVPENTTVNGPDFIIELFEP
jgi:hypothetical protein